VTRPSCSGRCDELRRRKSKCMCTYLPLFLGLLSSILLEAVHELSCEIDDREHDAYSSEHSWTGRAQRAGTQPQMPPVISVQTWEHGRYGVEPRGLERRGPNVHKNETHDKGKTHRVAIGISAAYSGHIFTLPGCGGARYSLGGGSPRSRRGWRASCNDHSWPLSS
jgi:hypothetical protein